MQSGSGDGAACAIQAVLIDFVAISFAAALKQALCAKLAAVVPGADLESTGWRDDADQRDGECDDR